jgi:hypothetical protein
MAREPASARTPSGKVTVTVTVPSPFGVCGLVLSSRLHEEKAMLNAKAEYNNSFFIIDSSIKINNYLTALKQSQYFLGSTGVLSLQYWSTYLEVLEYCLESTES